MSMQLNQDWIPRQSYTLSELINLIHNIININIKL